MEMLLFLPAEEQAQFADDEFKHFSQSSLFNEKQLFYAMNTMPDKRLEDPDSWTSGKLGNLAYMSIHAPEQYKSAWRRELMNFIEDKKIQSRDKIKSFSMMASSSSANESSSD
jgi:hypothetical protein